MGGVADRLDFRKAAALGSTFLSLGAAPEIAASAQMRWCASCLLLPCRASGSEGMDLLKLNPERLKSR
jgi:phage-related tail protein